MALTIKNRLVVPFTDKDPLKVIFGDSQTFEFTLPTPHQAGDAYHLGIDQDRVVYPPSRPLCAYSTAFTVSDGVLTMTLKYNTGRLREFVCGLKKPTPIYIQLDRVRNGVADTLLLDTLLALPSVLDSANIVVEGDPLAELLDAKMDKPAVEGTAGQILSLDENGQNVWRDEQEIPEQEQADWAESDSSEVSYIQNKPDLSVYAEKSELAAVATSGDYDDLSNKPFIPTKVSELQNDSDYQTESDVSTALEPYSLTIDTGSKLSLSMDSDYKLTIALLNASDTTLDSKVIDLPIESMIVNASYASGVLTLTLQNGQTISVDISDIVSGLVPDSRTVNGHALDADIDITASDLSLAAVAETGDYDDLSNKPVIPTDTSELTNGAGFVTAADLATVATTGDYADLSNLPTLPTQDELVPAATSSDEGKVLTVDSNGDASWEEPQGGGGADDVDYLCILTNDYSPGFRIDKTGSSTPDFDIEYSYDKVNWTQYTWNGQTGEVIGQASPRTITYLRGDNPNGTYNAVTGGLKFVDVQYGIYQRCGSLATLVSKTGRFFTADPNKQIAFDYLFDGFLGDGIPTLPEFHCGITYNYTFRNNGGLQRARVRIPQVKSSGGIYDGMFSSCAYLRYVEADIGYEAISYGYYSTSWLSNAGTSVSNLFKPTLVWKVNTSYANDLNGAYGYAPSSWNTVVVGALPSSLVPSTTSVTNGYVLTKTANGAEWAESQGGGDAPDGEDPLWVESESTSGGFAILYTAGWIGTIEYSYDKATWTSIVLDGTQTTLYTAVPFNGHHRVYLRKNAPNTSTQAVYIYGQTITRVGGNLSSMNTSYNGTAIPYEFNSLFGHPTSSNSQLNDISELKVPLRTLGANAMSYLFRGCTRLSETMPIPVVFSIAGMDTTNWTTGSWTNAFQGCTQLVRICLSQAETASSIDRNAGLYNITDNTLNGVISVENGISYMRVNCTDIAPNGKFSATAIGLPLLQNVQVRTSNTLNPGSPYVPHYTVGSGESRTLKLNDIVMASISGGANMVYGEVIIDCDANGTVAYNSTYFSTDSDPVVQGKRNWCVYRVLGDKAKMFVVDTQDLPSA